MSTGRRSYTLSKDQPILQQARRRREAHPRAPQRTESDFWKSFNLEKFARDWGRGLGKRSARVRP